jgi:hypothetical protein
MEIDRKAGRSRHGQIRLRWRRKAHLEHTLHEWRQCRRIASAAFSEARFFVDKEDFA